MPNDRIAQTYQRIVAGRESTSRRCTCIRLHWPIHPDRKIWSPIALSLLFFLLQSSSSSLLCRQDLFRARNSAPHLRTTAYITTSSSLVLPATSHFCKSHCTSPNSLYSCLANLQISHQSSQQLLTTFYEHYHGNPNSNSWMKGLIMGSSSQPHYFSRLGKRRAQPVKALDFRKGLFIGKQLHLVESLAISYTFTTKEVRKVQRRTCRTKG